MIVGWSIGNNMGTELVDDSQGMEVARRRPLPDLMRHTNHGSQYGSVLLDRTMRRHGITLSMDSISAPWDNSIAESLMSTVRFECAPQTFRTRDDARLDIFDYIEVFYNRMRYIHHMET